MKTNGGGKKIKLLFHHSFRRPVKIRVETEPLHSADWIEPSIPAGLLLPTTTRPAPLARSRPRVIRLELAPQPDWRIVGDHELMLQQETEVACQ